MPLWVIVTLVLTGIGVGFAEPGRFSYAFGAATLYVFLPPLLFEAAWKLDPRQLLGVWKPVFALAVPGVAITTAVVAGALVLSGFAWPPALLVGAMVSATDPIAVVAIFRRVAVPAKLSTIVQGEALLNDGMAVVLYRGMLLAIAGGLTVRSSAWATADALLGILVGVTLGITLAFAIAHLVIRRHGASTQIIATLGGAYAVYFAGDALHASGVFAVVAFGIALREVERRFITVTVVEDVERFWDVLALCANSLVFVLTGAAIDLWRVGHAPLAAAAALCGILAARLVLAYVLTPLAMGRFDRPWLKIVQVANARGALSLAMALALPLSIAARSTIIDVTFTVVLATLLSSAFTVPRAAAAFKS
ncbi:MAG TPA: cation:proton antiporter [Candidatus Baltobacteraceae bacterium]